MIERSSGLNHSYQTQTHEHMVTDCVHEEESSLEKNGGAANVSGTETDHVQSVKPQMREAFSLRNIVTNGWKSVVSKAVRFWNDSGEEAILSNPGEKGGSSRQEEAILATSIIKNDSPKDEEMDFEEENARKVSEIEGAVSGGLKKEQGNLRRFLQKFEETVLNATALWKKSKNVKSTTQLNVSPKGENHNYLMDSYNKSGEYSTLAKDRSPEGSFKARV